MSNTFERCGTANTVKCLVCSAFEKKDRIFQYDHLKLHISLECHHNAAKAEGKYESLLEAIQYTTTNWSKKSSFHSQKPEFDQNQLEEGSNTVTTSNTLATHLLIADFFFEKRLLSR